jgi:hypothetical protein
MARLNPRDVGEILQMLEDGINLMPKLDKREKMKMRIKIRKQFNWLSGLSNPTAEMLLLRLEERLSVENRLDFSALPCKLTPRT